MTTKITKKHLAALSACSSQVRLFIRAFSNGATVTKANLTKAVKVGLDLEWLAKTVLSAPACAEYEKVRDAAYAEYEKVCAPAYAEYEKVRDAARASILLREAKAGRLFLPEYEK